MLVYTIFSFICFTLAVCNGLDYQYCNLWIVSPSFLSVPHWVKEDGVRVCKNRICVAHKKQRPFKNGKNSSVFVTNKYNLSRVMVAVNYQFINNYQFLD